MISRAQQLLFNDMLGNPKKNIYKHATSKQITRHLQRRLSSNVLKVRILSTAHRARQVTRHLQRRLSAPAGDSRSGEERMFEAFASLLRRMFEVGRRCPIPVPGVSKYDGGAHWWMYRSFMECHSCQCHGCRKQSIFERRRGRHRRTLHESNQHAVVGLRRAQYPVSIPARSVGCLSAPRMLPASLRKMPREKTSLRRHKSCTCRRPVAATACEES